MQLPLDKGREILTQAVEDASKLVRDAADGLDFFKRVDNARKEGRETFQRVRQLHQIGQDVELSLRRREEQLQGVDRHELRGEDVLWKNTKAHLDRCHRILHLLRRELIGWDGENDPGFWRVTGLRLKLATIQKQTLARLHARLDTGFQALQLNTQAINVFVQVDTQERIGLTNERIDNSTSTILTEIAKLNRRVSRLSKNLDNSPMSPFSTQVSPFEQIPMISIPRITVDADGAEQSEIDPDDVPLLQETLTGARSVIESYDPHGESMSVQDPFYHSPSEASHSDEEVGNPNLAPESFRTRVVPAAATDWGASIYQDKQLPEPLLTDLMNYHYNQARNEFEEDKYMTAERAIIEAIEAGDKREKWHGIAFDRVGMQDLLAEIYKKQRKFEEALDVWIQLLPTQQDPPPPLTSENIRHYHFVADTYYQKWRTRGDEAALFKANDYAQTAFNWRFNSPDRDDNLVSETADLLAHIHDAIPDPAKATIFRRYVITPQPLTRERSRSRSPPPNRGSVGEDPDSVISPGHDPTNELVNAIRAKNVPRVIAILNRHDMNLDLERSYEEGLTPLMIAFKESRSEPIIQSLLEHRAKIYAEDENGRTVLHRAAASGDVEMVRLALAKNAGKEARDKNRLTPMLVTVSENHPKARECVQALLDAGDDMLARDKYDWTVVHFAAHNACRPERSNAPNAPVHALKLLRFLIERGAPVDAPAKNGDTALCLSAGMGHAPTVVVLLNVNAHVNHLNRRGRSPLYLAVNEKSVTKEHEAVVRALLDHNAIVDESILPPKWKDFKHLMRSSRSSPLDTLPPDVTAFRNVNRVNSTSTVATTASSGSTISRILGGIRRSNGS